MSEQAPFEGASWDAVGFLTAQHRQVEDLWQRLEGSGGILPDGRRLDLARRIVKALSVHTGIEQQLLYPAVRDSLTDGGKLADRSLEDHHHQAKRLGHLDGLGPEEPGFEHGFAQLMAEVRHHVMEEEQEIFPKLQGALGDVRMAQLAGRMDMLVRMAPTRPHPMAPQTPPANRLTGPVSAMVDRARDVVRPRAYSEKMSHPPER
ncbi:MAG: hemerythrin domain-containing protein [Acidimicrobiales bacterium]